MSLSRFKQHYMKKAKTFQISICIGLASVIIGALAFALSWNLYDTLAGPMPGTKALLLPGSLTLIYVWHPLFTEEISFWLKFSLQMFGQFFVVTVISMLCVSLVNKLRRVTHK